MDGEALNFVQFVFGKTTDKTITTQMRFAVAQTVHSASLKQGLTILGTRLVTPSLLPRLDRRFQTRIKCLFELSAAVRPSSDKAVSQDLA